MVSDFMQRKKLDKARQVNMRLHNSVIELIRSGCAHSGMSQAKFLEMCVIAQSARIPRLVQRLQSEALRIITDEMATTIPPAVRS